MPGISNTPFTAYDQHELNNDVNNPFNNFEYQTPQWQTTQGKFMDVGTVVQGHQYKLSSDPMNFNAFTDPELYKQLLQESQ